MKKIILSLAGVMAATAFAPEAAAVPSFARQTGMACSACHFQHFPVLNTFGMAFKAAGYTMMGAQGKVEGEHLSIPDTLNASMLMKIRYEKTNGTDAATVQKGTSTNSGVTNFPDEFSLFFGGRMSENTGFLAELNLNQGAGTTSAPTAAQFKMPFMYDVGGAKVGVIPFFTDAGSMAYGYELSSGGLVRALRWTEDRTMFSHDKVGISSGAATGVAFVAKNDMGYINFTRWAPEHMGSSGASAQMKSNWLRVAATPTVADWNMHIGLGLLSGQAVTTTGLVATAVTTDTKATQLDFQGQTEIDGKEMSVYAGYTTAPGSPTVGTANRYNTNANSEKSMSLGVDYSVIPHVLHVAAAFRTYDTGGPAPASSAVNGPKTNAIMLQGIYDLQQNIALHATFKKESGDGVQATGTATNRMYLMLEAAW